MNIPRTECVTRDPTDKTLYIPRCKGNEMQMVQVASLEDLQGFSRNSWGILEPSWEEDRVQGVLALFMDEHSLIIQRPISLV